MNYIKHLTGFFDRVNRDESLNPTHISLYVSLFQCWNLNRFKNPISISRSEVMRISKISAFATYHKCIKDLHNLGYLKYVPSFNPFKGSLVYLLDFEPVQKPIQGSNKQRTKKQSSQQTSTEQALVPYINSINITNNNSVCEENFQNPDFENAELGFEDIDFPATLNPEKQKRKKVAPQKENTYKKPSLDEVSIFFTSENYPTLEAKKFFNHFESNGWKVGGKTPMKNWQAAARNWMLNASRFAQPTKQSSQPNQIKPNGKNYNEPL